MPPRISVLIPVYGVEKYIRKCLISLFSNTIASDCEFIIVNDCTKDNSMKIIEDIITDYSFLKIKVINHETNLGLAGARNTGLKNASGKYIICCDSDDWVEKNYLEELYNEAEKVNADITGCDWIEEINNSSIYCNHNLSLNVEENFENFLKCQVHGYVWAKLIKHSLFTENNFEWIEGINNWEDECISLKLFSVAKKIAYVKKPLYHYICRPSSYIHSLLNEKTSNEFLNAISAMENYLNCKNFEQYKNLINYKKIHVKQHLLLCGTKVLQNKYIKLWSEIYPFLAKDSTLSFRGKIILKTAKLCPLISKILLFLLSFLRITIGKRYTWKQYLAK